MINYDYITKENIEEHSPDWPQILNRSCRILYIQDDDNTYKMMIIIALLIKLC